MEKSIAVVVTFNRLALLKECILALNNQSKMLDTILVINNGSTDGTAEWLRSQPDLLVISQENTGSGGGFETGIQWAYKSGYSWIWCMDDDGYPKEDAFEKLMEPELDQLYLRNCAVINKADKKSFVWKTKHYATIDDVDCTVIKGVGHPFNGTLIHRDIVEKVGTPRQKFFLWGDESEYYNRITRKNKIPVCTIADSIHYHPASAFSYKNDWDFKNTWKMYFYIRNRLHVQQAKFNYKLMGWVQYICFLTAFAGVILVYQKTDKLKKLNFILWPAMDAVKNDFNESPATILSRLNQQNGANNDNDGGWHLRNAFNSFSNLLTPFKVKRAAGI